MGVHSEQDPMEAEVQRRLALPLEQWKSVASMDVLISRGFARIDELERQDAKRG